MRKKQVVVIGSSDDTEYGDAAYRIGEFIAENHWVLLSGGRGGIMESVSRGAYDKNGMVVGILPGDNFEEANEYCNIVIPTGIGFARNIINILSADIVIAIGGKSGTLSELAYAWQYKKPTICCTFTSGWSKIFSELDPNIRDRSIIFKANSVEMVFDFLRELAI